MSDDIFSKLRDFVIKKSGVDNEPINRLSRIQEDLGVSGADAVEFIIAYGQEFNVDVSNFLAADYFEDEGGLRLLYLLDGLWGRNKKTKKQLTVGHLEKGIYAGKLDESVIQC